MAEEYEEIMARYHSIIRKWQYYCFLENYLKRKTTKEAGKGNLQEAMKISDVYQEVEKKAEMLEKSIEKIGKDIKAIDRLIENLP